jgi:hypothetical protein
LEIESRWKHENFVELLCVSLWHLSRALFLRFNFDGSFDQNYIEVLIVADSILTCHFIFLEIMEVEKTTGIATTGKPRNG